MVTHTLPPKTDGLALMRPPVWYAHNDLSRCPDFTANTRPSCEPKYADPVDHDGRGLDLSRRSYLPDSGDPRRAKSAVTVPSWDATRTRGPSIAGLEGSVPPTRCVHFVRPVAASIANVVPGKAVDEQLALAVDRRELDVASEPACPRELPRRETERGGRDVRANAAGLHRTSASNGDLRSASGAAAPARFPAWSRRRR